GQCLTGSWQMHYFMEQPALQTWSETSLHVASYAPRHGVGLRSALRDRPAVPQKTPPATRDPDTLKTAHHPPPFEPPTRAVVPRSLTSTVESAIRLSCQRTA